VTLYTYAAGAFTISPAIPAPLVRSMRAGFVTRRPERLPIMFSHYLPILLAPRALGALDTLLWGGTIYPETITKAVRVVVADLARQGYRAEGMIRLAPEFLRRTPTVEIIHAHDGVTAVETVRGAQLWRAVRRDAELFDATHGARIRRVLARLERDAEGREAAACGKDRSP